MSTKQRMSLQQIVDVAAKQWMNAKDIFNHAGVDHNGSIDRDELKAVLVELRLDHVIDFEGLWKKLDALCNRKITKFESWSHAFQDIYPVVSADDFDTAFEWRVKPNYQDKSGGLIALVAHNKMKNVMTAFVERIIEFFRPCRLVTTGSTGKILEKKGLNIHLKVASGPFGGDQEIGGLVTKGQGKCKVSAIFFFKDPLTAHMHDADIGALTRICDVHCVPYATNDTTGSYLVTATAYRGLRFHDVNKKSARVIEYEEDQKKVIKQVSGVTDDDE